MYSDLINMKKFLKFFIKSFLLINLLGFLFLLYLKSDFYHPIDPGDYDSLKTHIKQAKPLSNHFISVYNKITPITNANGFIFNDIRGKYDKHCPCLNISRFYARHTGGDKRVSFFKKIIIAWKLEKEFTQGQCLALLAEKQDFLNNTVGIEEAANFYFNKPINELDNRELATLVLMLKNASLYNPVRRSEMIQEKLNEYGF